MSGVISEHQVDVNILRGLISPIILLASLYDKTFTNVTIPSELKWDISTILLNELPLSQIHLFPDV